VFLETATGTAFGGNESPETPTGATSGGNEYPTTPTGVMTMMSEGNESLETPTRTMVTSSWDNELSPGGTTTTTLSYKFAVESLNDDSYIEDKAMDSKRTSKKEEGVTRNLVIKFNCVIRQIKTNSEDDVSHNQN
jgi:hypothetical protein